MQRAAWAAIDNPIPTGSGEVKKLVALSWHKNDVDAVRYECYQERYASFVIENRSPVYVNDPSSLSRFDLFGIPAPSIRQRERKMGCKYDDQPGFRNFIM